MNSESTSCQVCQIGVLKISSCSQTMSRVTRSALIECSRHPSLVSNHTDDPSPVCCQLVCPHVVPRPAAWKILCYLFPGKILSQRDAIKDLHLKVTVIVWLPSHYWCITSHHPRVPTYMLCPCVTEQNVDLIGIPEDWFEKNYAIIWQIFYQLILLEYLRCRSYDC